MQKLNADEVNDQSRCFRLIQVPFHSGAKQRGSSVMVPRGKLKSDTEPRRVPAEASQLEEAVSFLFRFCLRL